MNTKDIQSLTITDSEAHKIKQRFYSIPTWPGMEKQHPDFYKNINNLPSMTGYIKVEFLHCLFLDAVCDVKNIAHGSLDRL